MSASIVLAQESGELQERHFVDRFVDTVTSPEAGDRLADWIATGIEFIVLIALFGIPLLLLLGGARARRYGLATGGLVALMALWWYRSTEDWALRANSVLDEWQIPVGDWVEQVVYWVDNNLIATLEVIEWPFSTLLAYIVDEWLLQMSWLTICIAFFALGWAVRNFQVGLMSFVGLLVCGLLGDDYWRETALTIGFIGVAVLLCVLIGIPIGVLCGRVDGAWRVVRPVLDAMQVVHSFVYMLPFIFFFGIGSVSATMVTMTFALPPLIRLTNLGIRQVPVDVVEAARAYGAPERRVLMDVQLPLARPAIMTGLNQTLLLSISMLGIAAIMGAGGLGRLLFQAISNQDIALAGSAGLAFFLVAVTLDRISQPQSDDAGNLFSRIGRAWANRRTPENLLSAQNGDADTGSAHRPAREPTKPVESYVQPDSRERRAVVVTAMGSLVALLALLLPWSIDAGLISSYARSTDSALDGSFNGVAAPGGSWFGIFIAFTAAAALAASLTTLWRAGSGSRWLAPHGAVVFAATSLLASLAFTLAQPPDNVNAVSIGSGAYLAVLGSIVAFVGACWWLWCSPMSPRRPLPARVGWGRLMACSFAMVLLVMGGYSGWSYDTREGVVITPELQAEMDQIAAEARAKNEAARAADAAADAAAAAGDLELERQKRSEAIQALNEESVLAAEITAKRSEATRTGDIIHDGYESEGAGLGIWTLLAGLAALAFAIPAVGLTGVDESRRYRWSALVAAAGLGIAVVSLAWVFTIARVADTNLVSGAGVVFTMAAGVVLFASCRGTLGEFGRKKVYSEAAD